MNAVAQSKTIERDFSQFTKKHPFVFTIKSKVQYKKALDLLENIMSQSKINEAFLMTISNTISAYEDELDSVKELEQSITKIPTGIAAIRVLMDQYNLTMSDLPELGKKSNVSLILKGERNLTLGHVKAMANRFNVSPTLFLN
ncbi:MAG: transcriptional regulator [Kangiella sp.]|nr:MAG: transcriptional regulator [Kangiella sp.]